MEPTEDKDAKIAFLESTVTMLRRKLRQTSEELNRLKYRLGRQHDHEQDYVPYDEDDRR